MFGPRRKACVVLDRFDRRRPAESAFGQADAFALHHLEGPAPEGADGTQAADVAVQHAERVLHCVVDVGGAAADAGIAADVGLNCREQRGEGSGIATLRRCDELEIGARHQTLSTGLRPTMAQAGQ
jgi:hypothetical protein